MREPRFPANHPWRVQRIYPDGDKGVKVGFASHPEAVKFAHLIVGNGIRARIWKVKP